MSDQSSINSDVYYIEESTYGTTPSTPTLTYLQHKSCSLGISRGTIMDGQIRSDRQIGCMNLGVKDGAGDIVVELAPGVHDDLIEAALEGTWATDVLKVGSTRRSFTFVRKMNDISDKPYQIFTGAEINTMGVTINLDGNVEVTFGIIYKDMETSLSGPATATYGDATYVCPFNSLNGSILEGGSSISTLSDISFTLENGMEGRKVLFQDTINQPMQGKSNVSGSSTAYFRDSTLLDKYLDETESSIVITAQDSDASNSISFDMGRIKYTAGQTDTSEVADVTIPLSYQALYNSSDESQIVVTRVLA